MSGGQHLIPIRHPGDAWDARHRNGALVSRSGRELEDVAAPPLSYRRGEGVRSIRPGRVNDDALPMLAPSGAKVIGEPRRCKIKVSSRHLKFGPVAPLKPMAVGDLVCGFPIGEGDTYYAADDLMRMLCFVSGFDRTNLGSSARAEALVKARLAGFWVMKHFTPRSLPAIGRLFGGKDHTTALHGIRRVDSVIAALGLPVTADPVEMTRQLLCARWPSARSLARRP